jgi:hypothetical protein
MAYLRYCQGPSGYSVALWAAAKRRGNTLATPVLVIHANAYN